MSLRERIEAIMAPAIDPRAPYAKAMISKIEEALIDDLHSPMRDEELPLMHALRILATVHTRDDDVTGFVFLVGAAGDEFSGVSQHEHLKAWRTVRAVCHMQTKPNID